MKHHEAPTPVRIAVVHDEPLLRDLLARAFASCEELDVGFNVASGEALLETLQTAENAPPQASPKPFDVLLTDVVLGPGIDGLELSRRLRERYPDLGIVLLSDHVIPASIAKLGALRVRGFAYLLKSTTTDFAALHRAILTAATGGVAIDQAILAAGNLHNSLGRLTERQTEILHLAAQGYSNAALAQSLFLSPRTVENHLAQIYKELDIESDGTTLPRVRAVVMYLAARFPHLMQQLEPALTPPQSGIETLRPA